MTGVTAFCRDCGSSFHFEDRRVPDTCPSCKRDWRLDHFSDATGHDHEFGPLARYLDEHPGRHAAIMRHDGKWVIRVASSIGFASRGGTLGEAAASVCNALFADDSAREVRAELPTIPEKG